MVSGSGMEEFA